MPLDVACGIWGRSGPEGGSTVELGGDCPGVWQAVRGPKRGAVGWPRNPGGEGHPAGRPLAGPQAWAMLAFSMPCPVLLPLWLPKLLTPLLGGSPRVQAWRGCSIGVQGQ